MFEPAQLGHLHLKNRLIASPVTPNYASPEGFVTERVLQFYKLRAQSGVAMVITEGAYIHPTGKSYTNQLGIYNPILKPGLSMLAHEIHSAGAMAAVQLHHAGWRTKSSIMGRSPLSSEAKSCYSGLPPSQEMTTLQAEQIISAFASAALLAKQAGFDGVDIHGAHGYLITCFLSPVTNHRTDRFGGETPAGRAQFAIEVVKAIRGVVGDDFVVMMKLSADEFISGGYTVDDMKIVAPLLEEAGLNGVTISAGTVGGVVPFDAAWPQYTMRTLPMGTPHKAYAHFAQQLKTVLTIPVIAVGKVHTAQDAEDILNNEQADFIALGRALIADPMWPQKVREGREDEIRPCIACNQGCFDRLAEQQDVRCTVNANMGDENNQIGGNLIKRKVMVVGGGVAGMQAALKASEKGHIVSLWERGGELGGQMILAATPPDRKEINLDSEVTSELIVSENPDVVILATGGQPAMPAAFKNAGAISAWDLLRQPTHPQGHYIILGGGLVGCETADLLSENPNNSVTLVEMLSDVARDAGGDIKCFLTAKFHKQGVRVICEAKLESYENGMAILSVGGRKESLPCDYLVIAVGTRADQKLADELNVTPILTYVVGDALQPKKIMDAVKDASRVAEIL
jgi:2,4-dienoyl-CoA reductase-like NADH-dependent reductase (Old Yellow Enzyme family)/thioredoxin reductase